MHPRRNPKQKLNPLVLVIPALSLALMACGDRKDGQAGQDSKDGKKASAAITLETVKDAKVTK
jgi:hypothetical protein